MIGPTGVGKTEIARRLAKLAQAPFIKVEATKFTEVGYVGRDVEQIIRDLVEAGISLLRDKRRDEVQAQAHHNAEERVLDALVGASRHAVDARDLPQEAPQQRARRHARSRSSCSAVAAVPACSRSPACPAPIGMINIQDMIGKAFGGRGVKRKVKVKDAHAPLLAEEADKLLDQDQLTREAIDLVENHGIVFIDEIDKVANREGYGTAVRRREGVQRDLLPLIEGTTVSTKYGPVKTDHILFIASGAFHVAKPSDLLPELQGRLPIRVELKALTRDDLIRILNDTDASLIKQYVALMETEGVTLDFTDDAIEAIADAAVQGELARVENIGARRLQTVMERLVEEISFDAPGQAGRDDQDRRGLCDAARSTSSPPTATSAGSCCSQHR